MKREAQTAGGTTPIDALTLFGELDDEFVHPVQPYQARKSYVCPGCESFIEPGVGHLVVVPQDAPDLRRHWHRGCWYKERRRLGHHRSVNGS